MRIAVLVDIHGFSVALDTVLADIDRDDPFDDLIVAGDLCAVGPDPAGVLARLRERQVAVLQGNTDEDLAHEAATRPNFWSEQIGTEGIDYLANLPFECRITPPGGTSPDDDLLVVHANPHDLRTRLDPTTSDDELRDVIGDAQFGAIAYGHYHVDGIREIDGRILADVSAVGNPKDGDFRCKYGVMTWDEQARTWTAEIRHLPYPLEETTRQIMASGMPSPERTLLSLKYARY